MLLFYVSTFKAPFPLPEFWPDEIWVSNAASDDGAQHQYCFLQRVSNWNSWESILSIWNENLDLLWVIHARMNFWSGTWLHMGANCKKQLYIYRFIVSVIYTHTFFWEDLFFREQISNARKTLKNLSKPSLGIMNHCLDSHKMLREKTIYIFPKTECHYVLFLLFH